MALDTEPGEMCQVLAPIESDITTKKKTEAMTEENLEEKVKEENVVFLISDKEVRKKRNQIQKIHICPYKYCEQSFSRPWRLASHIHSHIGQRSHICEVPGCEKAYFNSSHLRRHMATSHRPQSLYKTLLKCPHPSCMMQLSSSCSLKRHYWRIHKQQRLFTCTFCDKGFSKHSQWQAHLYEHTGVPPITCPTCHLGFMSQRDFNRHNRRHLTTYTCDFPDCGQQFECRAHLLRHITLHHPTQFICDICNRSFKAKCRLLTHMSVHQESSQREVLSCPYINCARSYYHKRNLVYHIKVSHNGKRTNHEWSAKNVTPQSEREQLEQDMTKVLQGEASKGDSAPEEGSTEKLRMLSESDLCESNSLKDTNHLSSSRDCSTEGGECNKTKIKVECDSYIDAYQLPSCGEMEQKENSVLYAVKTEILEQPLDVAAVKEEIKDEITTEEHEMCLGRWSSRSSK